MIVLEATEKLTYGSAIFAAASRSRSVNQMPEIDKDQFPALSSAVRANDKDEEAMFVAVVKSVFTGIRAQIEADQSAALMKSK